MANPSPICLVNSTATTNGVNISASSTVTIALADVAGVRQWNLSCINTDEQHSPTAITASLNINLTTKTATFTAPSDACALIFQSKINGGIDLNGIAQTSYTTTFKTAVLTNNGKRKLAFNETLENSATTGYTGIFNDIIENLGLVPTTAGAGLTLSGQTLNVGQNADNSITVNADDIQLKSAYQTLLDGATDAATASTLAQRNSSGQITLATSLLGSAQYGGNIIIDKATAYFSISQTGQTTDVATNDIVIVPQAPYGSATGSNRLPGDFVVNIPGASGALATTNSGNFEIIFNGDPTITMYQIPSTAAGVIEFNNGGTFNEVLSIQSSTSSGIFANNELSLYGTPVTMVSTGSITATADDNFSITATSIMTITGGLGIVLDGGAGTITINSGGDYTIGSSSAGFIGCDGLLTLNPLSGLLLDDAGGGDINVNSISSVNIKSSGTTRIQADTTGLGFFAAAPVAKPTVTGAKVDLTASGALASLLTALANLGLITDSSS